VQTCGVNLWLSATALQGIISDMKLRLLVEHDPVTNRWSAVFPELPGCASAGDTEAEAVANAREALSLWFDPAPIDLPKNAKVVEVALP
jgi:predicted RNase H-like HicB family nuclease